jgi:hypothetical protein
MSSTYQLRRSFCSSAGEHRELRWALGLTSVPDFTTLYRFLQRLDDQIIDQAVGETVRRLRDAGRAPSGSFATARHSIG